MNEGMLGGDRPDRAKRSSYCRNVAGIVAWTMATNTYTFSNLLKRRVDEYTVRTTRTQHSVAIAAGIHPSQLTRLVKGTRRVTSSERVLALASALELGESETSELLEAAGFRPLTDGDRGSRIEIERLVWQTAERASEHLRIPERDMLQTMMREDVILLTTVLEEFGTMRKALYARDWAEALRLADRGIAKHWELRRAAARVHAHQLLIKATAQQHRGPLADALHTARQALQSAKVAGDMVTLCLAHSRIGNIERALGHFTNAEISYSMALGELARRKERLGYGQQRWREHWRARVESSLAVLHLFRGRPADAVPYLERCLEDFERLEHPYECVRVMGLLVWAYTLVGQWEDAEDTALCVLRRTNDLDPVGEDPKLHLHAHLSLGGVYLNKGQYVDAELELKEAIRIAEQASSSPWKHIRYPDVGRAYLLLALVHLQCPRGRDMRKARKNFELATSIYGNSVSRGSARLAYVHINYGNYYMAAGSPSRAFDEYMHAYELSGESDPPNDYYRAGALVEASNAALEIEEVRDSFDVLVTEARDLCQAGHYWRHLAKLELTCCIAASRWGNISEAGRHGSAALEAAARYNDFLFEELRARLDVFVASLPSSDRDGMAKVLGIE